MSNIPMRCVVDTNVATTANGSNPGAPADCVAESARALAEVMTAGHVFVDEGGEIVKEYRANLSAGGQPGPGDMFLKWLLTNEWGQKRVTRIAIKRRGGPNDVDFEELPAFSDGTVVDASDRKFVAVAAASPEKPPLLQSFDSKWWGWQTAFAGVGLKIHYLCPKAIAKKYAEKMEK